MSFAEPVMLPGGKALIAGGKFCKSAAVCCCGGEGALPHFPEEVSLQFSGDNPSATATYSGDPHTAYSFDTTGVSEDGAITGAVLFWDTVSRLWVLQFEWLSHIEFISDSPTFPDGFSPNPDEVVNLPIVWTQTVGTDLQSNSVQFNTTIVLP